MDNYHPTMLDHYDPLSPREYQAICPTPDSDEWTGFMNEWHALQPPVDDGFDPEGFLQSLNYTTQDPLLPEISIDQAHPCDLWAQSSLNTMFPLIANSSPMSQGSSTEKSHSSPATNLPHSDSSLSTLSSQSSPIFMSNATPSNPSSTPSTSPEASHFCNLCPKSFSKRHLLNRHLKQHTKPIKCPVSACGHRTAKKREMQRHIDVHHSSDVGGSLASNTRHFCAIAGCEFAVKGFKRKDHLTRHMKRVH